MSITVSGEHNLATRTALERLVREKIASRIAAHDATIWGADAAPEAAMRLGWTDSASNSAELVDEIVALRESLQSAGVDRVVLCGMGGSSLAPEVITSAHRVELTVLDSTDPGQVAKALGELSRTVVVISSKSGSTVETDSHRRIFTKSFSDAGIDPTERIIVVTDPGSPLEKTAREAGYRVFFADPTVGGRYSALTAFGLVPSGLAGADIAKLLQEAQQISAQLGTDSFENPALCLAALISANPERNKLGIVAEENSLPGFGDWVEQLIAESTGKNGTGLLPLVLDAKSYEVSAALSDVQLVKLAENATPGITVHGDLGAQFLLWEFATAIAGLLLKINPFDQPDVESAKAATRALLNERPAPSPALFVDDGIQVRAKGFDITAQTIEASIDALIAQLPENGYLAIHAYLDRTAHPELIGIRETLARRAKVATTFGWGPRFLHSTGQYHKGGPATGVFLQIVAENDQDLEIPGLPFSFGQLIRAQATGDASVLAAHARPVLTLSLDPGQLRSLGERIR